MVKSGHFPTLVYTHSITLNLLSKLIHEKLTSMPIIIKIGPRIIGIFWALVTLLGVILTIDGFFYAVDALTTFGEIALTNISVLSHLSGGIVIFVLGLVATGVGYFGLRGRIIITTSEDTKQTPS